jgi:porin
MTALGPNAKAAYLVLPKAVAVAVFLCTVPLAVADGPAADKPYSGEFLTRSTVTGDWGDLRNELAGNGVTFDATVTQTDQGVVHGGKRSGWAYGGRGNLTTSMDSGKVGLWPGGVLKLELEGNWGHAVNDSTGALMTVDTNQAFPVVAATTFGVPDFSLRQSLSSDFSLIVGKIDTIATGDMNAFAQGKGEDQFMNLAFNINPVLIMTVPYSTLGVGVVCMPAKDPGAMVASLLLVSSVGEATTSGFSELSSNALTLTGEARMRTDFFGLTGHQLAGFTYSNKEFGSLTQRLGDYLESGAIAKKKGSWALIYNFDQFVHEPWKGSGQGVGIFGRLGVSDGNPNPARTFASLGLAGKGAGSRPLDQYGMAWYYLNVTSPQFVDVSAQRVTLQNEQGIEAYYSFALTPWAVLTANAQWVNPTQKVTRDGQKVDPATVLGLRLWMAF